MTQAPYDRAALLVHARASIMRGSKSFAAASRLFDRTTRERAWLLYAWCRACDDLADAQDHGHALGEISNPEKRLATIRSLTAQAFAGERSGNPAFNALGLLARECGITPAMAEDVIDGFALDTADWRPRDEADMLRYCFHVAGAVGVMMAVVMGVAPEDEDTLDRACDLGIAFQLANIVRDVAENAAAGRHYLPTEWLAQAGIAPGEMMKPDHRTALASLVRRACRRIEAYESSARIGAGRLQLRQRWAVLSAAGIYGGIAREVARQGELAWETRVVTSRQAKLFHVARGLWQAITPSSAAPAIPFSRRELAALAQRDRLIGRATPAPPDHATGGTASPLR